MIAFVRFLTQLISITVCQLDRLANWFLGMHKRSLFVRDGACNKCGKCCEVIGIKLPGWMARRALIVRFFVAWHRVRYNFEYLNVEDNYILYRCRYVRDGKCPIYWRRPRLCREYPRALIFTHDHVFPECGFKFHRKHKTEFRDVMKGIGR